MTLCNRHESFRLIFKVFTVAPKPREPILVSLNPHLPTYYDEIYHYLRRSSFADPVLKEAAANSGSLVSPPSATGGGASVAALDQPLDDKGGASQ